MTNNFRHVGIVVSDLEVHKTFLTEVLEFSLVNDLVETGPFISRMLNLEAAVVNTVKYVGHSGGVIELLKFAHPLEDTNKVRILKPNSQGLAHVAITVSSADLIHERAIQNNLTPFTEPLLSPDHKVKVFYMRGPENVLFEIVEEL